MVISTGIETTRKSNGASIKIPVTLSISMSPSGKSSFLYSLLGEMKFPDFGTRPKVKINGSMSLVTQKPWIINDTVRNNILFGKEFNRKKYE
jgi:ABC-type transport system involved in cytochrome bd biosynthesis fused ATPase/permease subunit